MSWQEGTDRQEVTDSSHSVLYERTLTVTLTLTDKDRQTDRQTGGKRKPLTHSTVENGTVWSRHHCFKPDAVAHRGTQHLAALFCHSFRNRNGADATRLKQVS